MRSVGTSGRNRFQMLGAIPSHRAMEENRIAERRAGRNQFHHASAASGRKSRNHALDGWKLIERAPVFLRLPRGASFQRQTRAPLRHPLALLLNPFARPRILHSQRDATGQSIDRLVRR